LTCWIGGLVEQVKEKSAGFGGARSAKSSVSNELILFYFIGLIKLNQLKQG
jgi:hypothetical protein